ncbi:hypothetical protein [Paenibacillus sp. L3-i20]|uniref:hypothetical protein n=1 Tax=Paenibacillus sp. L3-i20 TaxID=2905833 RepID=UPI001EDE812E|nr:hypothetical protein [Paenibacillus sp. L3-i20]GKU78031.1 hypothetical protein L3i20_v224280 [Paenibacillus sp. L3-i20]
MSLTFSQFLKAVGLGLISAVIVSGINIGISSAIGWFNGNGSVDVFATSRIIVFFVVLVLSSVSFATTLKEKNR